MKFVITADDCLAQPELFSRLGGKARPLAELQTASLPVPDWFAVAAEQYDAQLSPTKQRELTQALAALCVDGALVAVRSSAHDEDGAGHSFAGQFDSFLNVAPHQVAEKIVAVWHSALSERATAYRRQHGLAAPQRPPAVLIQRMVRADAAGVAFSADPVTGQRGVAVVSAVAGLGAALVAGECDADTFRVDRAGRIISRQCVASAAVLSDAQARAVADLARSAASFFGCPQDIEWAMEGGEIFLLQSRPITSLAQMADPDGALQLWDNSNIAESYSGVTTPLTFSFARRAYEEVYRQFCRLMRVPAAKIAAHEQTFKHMLGLVSGRVYYNLLNWYRVLALLPGFALNRRFMEQMMGVKEGMPESLLAEIERADWRARARDAVSLALTMSGLIANHFSLPRRITQFHQRLNSALESPPVPLTAMRPDELAAYYRRLESQLLTRWDAPLVNDFFAMIFYGLLRRWVEAWPGDEPLHNALLCGEGGIISAEPARRLQTMARVAAHNAAFVQTLCTASLPGIQRQMRAQPEFQQEYQSYLAAFGDRCLDELKLESATLHDDPLPLLRAAGHLAQRAAVVSPAAEPTETAVRQQAEDSAARQLRGHPLQRLLFHWLLRQTRDRVRQRENLRFERTRLFGRVRQIFVELGKRFTAMGLLDDPRDVFYLEVEEALGFLEGTATATRLRELAAVRRAEFAAHSAAAAPAGRFTTRGGAHLGREEQASPAAVVPARGALSGLGCSPGVVRGRVRRVTDPRQAQLQKGEILMAERTDPGWITVFVAASGLLIERGSLLSHAAIVARELNIPAIVSIPGLMRELRDGDLVEFNGSTGQVRRLSDEPALP